MSEDPLIPYTVIEMLKFEFVNWTAIVVPNWNV